MMRTCFRCQAKFESDGGTACEKCRIGRKPRRTVLGMPLSSREKQIVAFICKGLTNKEIANELYLSEGCIKVYLYHVFKKIGSENRTQLAVYAVSNPEIISGRIDT